jgi:tetratricopeptide (TPR) repeat protein
LVECLQGLGQIDAAAGELEKFVQAHPDNTGARLRLASFWIEQKKTAAAQNLLKDLQTQNDTDAKWKHYLEGRLLLAQDQAAPALVNFEELLQNPSGMPESLFYGATLGSAEARGMLNGIEAAESVLERFISRNSESGFLEEAFRRLDEIYEQEDHPSDSELKKWMLKAPPQRAALAHYYFARLAYRAHKFDKAQAVLETFTQAYPQSPLLNSVCLLRADLYLEKDNLPAAVRALDEAMRRSESEEERAEIELRTALVQYRQGESLLAGSSFRRAAEGSKKLQVNATFDAALVALNMRNYERFFDDYRKLSSLAPESPLRSDLMLEEGLAQARTSDPRAADTIELFLHNFPKSPRQSEARIALAELAFQDGDRDGAARYLKIVDDAPPTAETAERAAYLKVFLADSATPPTPSKVLELGSRFVREYPHSPYLPEVRMKLGQTYSRTGDHANAETQFTLLAEENPNSPYAETALFLAGQAATKWLDTGAVDRALRLFDEVVKRDGPLKLYARQQQAIVQSKLGRESEAVTIDDAILSAQPPPEPELRFATLCSKADNLATLGHKDPAQFEAAVAVYDSLAALPEVTPAWRNQALYKKGRAFEELGRQEEALTAYYDVLDRTVNDGHEFFWFYKAGFDAAQLFEQQQNWKAAIGIYKKMAKLEGPRSPEVKARLDQLRLEKFIWD